MASRRQALNQSSTGGEIDQMLTNENWVFKTIKPTSCLTSVDITSNYRPRTWKISLFTSACTFTDNYCNKEMRDELYMYQRSGTI